MTVNLIKTLGWGDGSVDKALSVHARVPEFRSLSPSEEQE